MAGAGIGSKPPFCSVFFATTLCLLVLLHPPWSCAKTRWRRQASQLKLAGKHEDFEDPPHSHSTSYQKNGQCPPPPQTLPEQACEAPGCQSDSECEKPKRCCYNGCIYACLESVPPPPAETCSTTEDGDDPLHCPTGFECHIIHPGNADEGIPNQGQCIKLRGNSEGWHLRPKSYKDYLGHNSNSVVGYEKQQQKHLG